jgi:hypothetical protein
MHGNPQPEDGQRVGLGANDHGSGGGRVEVGEQTRDARRPREEPTRVSRFRTGVWRPKGDVAIGVYEGSVIFGPEETKSPLYLDRV